jgi:DNA helicase-2/ATP-dependent DNA helicase PcrA
MLPLQLLNENQLQAVMAPIGGVLVIAGAGTGKTRVLTMRIAYLINELKFDSKHILAITFTNRAANEMRGRVDKIVGTISAP